MEQWEALIEACPSPLDVRYFSKAVQTASVVLKEDLAHFEIEWILQTFLYKPVNAVSLVRTKRSDEIWSRTIGDAFKLLGEATEQHCQEMETHFEKVVKLCLLYFDDAHTRTTALQCLTCVARVTVAGAQDVCRHIANLEETSTGRAPLAVLIGTICEHHPQTIENEFNKLWPIFLNLLDSSKNTDKIKSSILQGILGLLKHFGCDLPTAELNGFYDKMVADYIRIARCEEACLKILAEYSFLFRERISRDVRIRIFLWNNLHNSTGTSVFGIKATTSVYKSICGCLSSEQMQRIATAEVLPQVQSHRTQVKYTALRILTFVQTNCRVNIVIDGQTDAQTLEFELRNDDVSYDVAEAVAWCIESNVPSSETLLQTAILFYQHLPSTRRKEIVVHGILNATDELRSAAIKFLISESTVDVGSLENHLKLWKDIFDCNDGKDLVVVDKSKHVFEDFMSYTVFVLDGYHENAEKPPEKLTNLLQLATHVLTYQSQEDYSNDHCVILLPLLTELLKLHPDSFAMAAATSACSHIQDPIENQDILKEFYQVIDIERCKDEALLCEACVALVQMPTADASNVLAALQITFSRNDVEPKILSKALNKLEKLIVTEKNGLVSTIFNDTIHLVEKLHGRKDLSGKDARTLHRDVVLFLGKYGNTTEINNNCNENTIIVKLMDSLNINIANPDAGTNYKLNLQRILQLALEHEDTKSLQTLLVIICAHLSTKKDPPLQLALARVCLALSRSHARGQVVGARALQAAVAMCDSGECVLGLLQHISEEKSPGVRKMLSDALEALLVGDRGDDLISSVAEQATAMMTSRDSKMKRAGLNISETLISVLKDNNLLTTRLLPDLLILITKTYEIDAEITFASGSKLFIDKIELFDHEELMKLQRNLLEILLQKTVKRNARQNKMADDLTVDANGGCDLSELDVKIFKNTTKMVLEFIKNVFEYKKVDKAKILETYKEFHENENCDFEKSLYVSAKLREVFGLDSGASNRFFCMAIRMEEPYFCMEASLIFLQEHAATLLELHYQETLEFLDRIITALTPQCIKHLHRQIKSCLSVYCKNKIPTKLQNSFENWCFKLPIAEITNSIEKEVFTSDHAIIVNALKIMLSIFDCAPLTDLANHARKWSKILLKLFSNGYIINYLKSKMAFLTDILTVSVKFLKDGDVKRLILEGSNLEGLPSEKIGVQFCRFFIHVFYDSLVQKPFLLLDEEMCKCSIILNDIVKYTLKKKCTNEQYQTVLELVDKLWLKYETQTTFNQKQSLLLDMNNLPEKLGPDSNPLLWAINNLVYSEASREDKARLIGVLPGGDSCSQAYRSFASTLPTRLSEAKGGSNASFRAILDALANTRDLVLLNIVMALASGDDTKGWWDEAIDSCMASIAPHGDSALCKAVYTRCWDGLSLGVCKRMLLPLLRYSTSSFNEQFFSTVLNELLNIKVIKISPTHYKYHKNIVDCTRSLSILQVAFEKIPPTSLESPSSSLYNVLKATESWHLVRRTCRLCHSLRSDLKLPDTTDGKLKEDYRLFQSVNYNCFAAAVCRRRPDEKFYEMLFKTQVWDSVVDPTKEYSLAIRHQWNQRTKTQPISIDIPDALCGRSSLTASIRSVRTKMFMRTLSEAPLMYDLIATEDNEVQTQDIRLPSNDLNSHECAGTLTALVCHVTSLAHATWRRGVQDGLSSGSRNARWLLAQVICNCKEELKPHASALRPALLDVVASTATEVNGKTTLNGLHIDILETLTHWGDDSPSHSTALDSSLKFLITTALEHRKHTAIFRSLVDVLTKFLNVYAGVINVSLDVFQPYLADPETPKTLQILERISKANVCIPSLLPTLLDKLENKQYYQLSTLAKLLGLALNACKDRQPYLIRFRKVLDQMRKSNAGEYVKMLYYAQSGCPQCCDEYNFRMITNLTQKMPDSDKTNCLKILSTYIASSSSEYIQELFETIDVADLILQESLETFDLIKEGVKTMSESVRRRLVILTAKYCSHALVKVRKAANEVMLKAFGELFSSTGEPLAKKPKTSTSFIIAKLLSKDFYTTTVLSAIACGLTDIDGAVSKMVREGVAKMLHKDMGIRFAVSFFLTVYLPITSDNNTHNLSVCVYALLEILLFELRGQDRFKIIKLREEPLEMRSSNCAPSKLLTMSRTYQGTFRRRNFTGRRTSPQAQESNLNTPDIDVQISVESVLDTFMQFSKVTPETSQALCLQLIQAIKPRFDLGPELATCLAAILDRGLNELTPFVADVCALFIDDVCKIDGFQSTVGKLRDSAMNSEAQIITNNLYQEMKLRCNDYEQFVLGSIEDSSLDVIMNEDMEFAIEDLTSAFGKLANWDNLTIQQKNRIRDSGLPPLWTSKEIFLEQLETYTTPIGWFSKMASAYRQEDKENVMKWLRDMDKWPKRRFYNSAVTEAIEWQGRGEEPNQFPSNIHPSDCLAEWAARFMIRTAYQTSLANCSDERLISSRHDELKWCEESNRRRLGTLVLDCVKRNTPDLYESETLAWLRHKVWAMRDIGVLNNDADMLRKALNTAETYTPQFVKKSTSGVIVDMNKLIVVLNKDLNSLSGDKIQEVFEIVDKTINSKELTKNRQSLCLMYEIALTYYDDLWETDTITDIDKNSLLKEMLDILKRCTDLGISIEGFLAVILNRLDSFNGEMMNEDMAKLLLDQINNNLSSIDDFTLQLLLSHLCLFPSRLLARYPFLSANEDDNLVKYKWCFELTCDAEYTLLQYCSQLRSALKKSDEDEWDEIFRKIKRKLFENPYAGSDFQLLNRFKTKLFEICEYDMSPTFKLNSEKILKEIGRILSQRVPVNVLRLSQLCPALSRCEDCPASLLGARDNVTVVRIDEQVTVLNSIRRPAVIKVVFSDGTSRRYLLKSGESLKVDAAAQKVLNYAGRLWKKAGPVVCYNVTPLGEDCGLIEFLEDHVTLRNLIGGPDVLDAVLNTIPRPADHKLILSPIQANLSLHLQLCDKIPSYLLRDAVTRRSANERDRCLKMKSLQDTLGSATILTWILGIGDRHLENTLYSIQNGRLCVIDWGAILQYGRNELPPARLTRNLLAVCDTQVLEAQLQQLLTSLQESKKLFVSVIKTAFKWMGEEFKEKLPYIESILQGSSLSYIITRQALEQSQMEDLIKNKHLDLLDSVFQEFPFKETYTVDEQISCLLRQCTDPKILSVTRSGWEPWI